MKQLSLPFRLRPSFVAGAVCILLSYPVSAAEMSRLPQSSPLVSSILQLGDAATSLYDALPESRTPLLAKLTTSLAVASRGQAEHGFVHVDELELQQAAAELGDVHSIVETITAAQDAEGPVAKFEYSDTVVALASTQPAKPGNKMGYIKALPHELAVKAKALSAHISEKFKVDPAHANQVVTSAIQTASKTGLPPTLVLAVIAVESSFKATARNGNARGLMQIIPFWHKEKVKAVGGPEELMKVDKNIATGTAILKEYIDRNGSVFQGLYRYNASPKAKEYSEKVLKQKNGFEAVMTSEP